MPELSPENLALIRPLLDRVREDLKQLAGDDKLLLHSMRRYIAKRLEFDERGNPTQRRKLHELKWKKQRGLCAICAEELPERGSELDRFNAVDGYTEENTRLVHHDCHREAQKQKGFA